jgi:hypothetical protein
MSEEKTRELAKFFVENVEAQTYEEVYAKLNPDGRFIMIGKTPASGVFLNRKDVFDRLAPLLANYKTRPTIRFSQVLVDGDQAFLRASGKGEGIYGVYEQPYYGYYFRVEGDGYAEIIEYLDTVQLEVALFGSKLERRPEYQ